MEFAQRSVSVIGDFAHQLQLPAATLSEDGTFSFHFERAGTLTFAASADGSRVILSLTAAHNTPHTAEDLCAHFAQAQFDTITRLPVSAGLSAKGSRILAANIPEDRFDVQTIETCLDRLIDMMAA